VKIILDTCTFLWLASADHQLSKLARKLIRSPANEVFFSAASAWEISVKHAIGRLRLPGGLTPTEFIPEARTRHDVEALPVTEVDTFELVRLPTLHNDPFDRMLICQAIANQMAIVTPDKLIHQYSVGVQW
jgi:PIN domain nuclease of toxin-antitoxin system